AEHLLIVGGELVEQLLAVVRVALAETEQQVVHRRVPACVVRVEVATLDLAVHERELHSAGEHGGDEGRVVRAGRGASHRLVRLRELAVELVEVVGVAADGFELVDHVLVGDRHAVDRRRRCARSAAAAGGERAEAQHEGEGALHDRARLAAGAGVPESGGTSWRRMAIRPSTSSDVLRTGSWSCLASALYTASLTSRPRRTS